MDASPPSSGVARRLECRHRCFRDTQQRLPSGTILCLEGNALNDGGEVGIAALVELFAENIDWDIPGDLTVVTWIGPRRHPEAVRHRKSAMSGKRGSGRLVLGSASIINNKTT